VGPVWHGGQAGEQETLADCYRACLAIALARRFTTIAFPAISTGVYGFPRELAAQIAIATVAEHLAAEHVPETVIFVCFDAATRAVYEIALADLKRE
jgi:O-acetyl-ADP-ribose deacetylase (regulator of RNase III)